jgi:hypothetical protein
MDHQQQLQQQQINHQQQLQQMQAQLNLVKQLNHQPQGELQYFINISD